ncbi:LOW QUALITY PROTEIN: hypothetical protein BU14_0258s0017 [Porphyra umbilicalis]|uniref:Uncharacterized protein n=1 Tax=Porphyra umbilicalis TaxID=2786 RepID=A0A1X6P2B2_PORUM|nr:LOW QUALITY PROTEIN: hypothetical protein BU14_0258s0017 [Porphyra umbilicalis]|eukprot:OSX75012.1 LOW QUALITY PROTEIN: hypothetical protein BU14_0258s0017 [Porphyra umbilicalis]
MHRRGNVGEHRHGRRRNGHVRERGGEPLRRRRHERGMKGARHVEDDGAAEFKRGRLGHRLGPRDRGGRARQHHLPRRLAATSTVSAPISAWTASTMPVATSSVAPTRAIMPPSLASAAACIAAPRRATSRRASSKDSAPPTVRAVYSPRLKPAAAATPPVAGSTPASRRPARAAMDDAKMAGCATSVRSRTSLGPSRMSVDSGTPPGREAPRMSSAAARTAAAAGDAAAHAVAIPTACAPWPGHRMTAPPSAAAMRGGGASTRNGGTAGGGGMRGATADRRRRGRRERAAGGGSAANAATERAMAADKKKGGDQESRGEAEASRKQKRTTV